MNMPRKPEVTNVLAQVAEGVILLKENCAAAQRRAEGWHHFADDLIAELAQARKTEFRSGLWVGLAGGAFLVIGVVATAWTLL